MKFFSKEKVFNILNFKALQLHADLDLPQVDQTREEFKLETKEYKCAERLLSFTTFVSILECHDSKKKSIGKACYSLYMYLS